MNWAKETQVETNKKAQLAFGNINSIDLFNMAENAIKEMRKLQFPSFNMEEMKESDGEDIKKKKNNLV